MRGLGTVKASHGSTVDTTMSYAQAGRDTLGAVPV